MTLDELLVVDRSKTKEDYGTLYVVELSMIPDEPTLVKVGITSQQKPEDRWMQFAKEIWVCTRRFPSMYPKRFKRVEGMVEKEKIMHDYLAEYRYQTKKQWGGWTETYKMPLDKVVEVYDKVVKGEELPRSEEKCPICGREAKFDGKCALDCEERINNANKDK